LREEILARFEVLDLPRRARLRFLQNAAAAQVAGGRLYDAHIAEVARLCGARIVVTDNPRHFQALHHQGVRVLTASQLVSETGL
jgi:predicted nucleic acid-binding protein